jgi:hypothetical protein
MFIQMLLLSVFKVLCRQFGDLDEDITALHQRPVEN